MGKCFEQLQSAAGKGCRPHRLHVSILRHERRTNALTILVFWHKRHQTLTNQVHVQCARRQWPWASKYTQLFATKLVSVLEGQLDSRLKEVRKWKGELPSVNRRSRLMRMRGGRRDTIRGKGQMSQCCKRTRSSTCQSLEWRRGEGLSTFP